jgi:hypothetical protein
MREVGNVNIVHTYHPSSYHASYSMMRRRFFLDDDPHLNLVATRHFYIGAIVATTLDELNSNQQVTRASHQQSRIDSSFKCRTASSR